jgi:Kef-type K+ transport system membrane component KefB
MSTSIFIDTSLILSVAICIAFLVQLLKQPMIISYVITGIVCGPLLLGLTDANHEFFNILAEIGVILLLFLVGLSLNISYLRKIGKVAVITGVGQVIFTSLIGFGLLLTIGFVPESAIYLAIAITFSSTIVIMKLLSDKKELRTVHGRYTLGLMLVQDIIAIVIMIMLPVFQEGQSLWLSLGMLLTKGAFVLLAVYLFSKIILPILLRRAASSGEFLLIFSLAWCFSLAGFGAWAGLSAEVGAIIAGLSLGSSIYKEEIGSRIRPLRDFFIALFFIILGSEMNVDNFGAAILPSLLLSVFVLIGNPMILYFLYRRCKFTRKNSFLAGLTAAQVSEFGFVFLFIAQRMGFVDSTIISIFTIVALTTIFASSYLITYNYQVYVFIRPIFKLFGRDKHRERRVKHENFDVIVFGYHRLGWKICEALKEKEVKFAVVDCDPLAIDKMIKRNIPYFFGEANDIEFLSELPLDKIRMAISTIPRAEDQIALIKYIRTVNSKSLIITSLTHTNYLDEIYDCGANYTIIPHLISGQWIGDILKEKQWSKRTFTALRAEQRKEMRLRFNLERN